MKCVTPCTTDCFRVVLFSVSGFRFVEIEQAHYENISQKGSIERVQLWLANERPTSAIATN